MSQAPLAATLRRRHPEALAKSTLHRRPCKRAPDTLWMSSVGCHKLSSQFDVLVTHPHFCRMWLLIRSGTKAKGLVLRVPAKITTLTQKHATNSRLHTETDTEHRDLLTRWFTLPHVHQLSAQPFSSLAIANYPQVTSPHHLSSHPITNRNQNGIESKHFESTPNNHLFESIFYARAANCARAG